MRRAQQRCVVNAAAEQRTRERAAADAAQVGTMETRGRGKQHVRRRVAGSPKGSDPSKAATEAGGGGS